jgi:Patatin-like phospholipase
MAEKTDGGWELPTEECDLVMRGGVTSGAVYPSALMEIARRYQLRNLGGASAGAIAAVGAAACEYGRQVGKDKAAFSRLGQVIDDIKSEGVVRDLFQPNEATRLAFEIGLQLVDRSESYSRRIRRALKVMGRRRRRDLAKGGAVAVVWAAAVAAAAVSLAGHAPAALGIASLVALAFGALCTIVLLTAGFVFVRVALDLNRALVSTRRFGLCSGMTEGGHKPGSAVTDWLHRTIQTSAGLDDAEPLTFRMLEEAGDDKDLKLRLVTTDLSSSRPVTLPLPEPTERGKDEPPYLFEEEEFGRLFPESVLVHLRKKARGPLTFAAAPGKTFYELPGLDLPIVVAARLSLSFPVLMETVPLWRKDGWNRELVRHAMSDGGISSNFPIHFFDSLLPRRPTFGLDLQPKRAPSLKLVEMSNRLRPALFTDVADLPTFSTQILNAARNWRDNMQSELPGYRDRVCLIRLSAEEGGLNLEMDTEVVDRLVERGARAGRRIVHTSSSEWWDAHRTTRYRVLMQMLQRGLGRDKGLGRDCVYNVRPARGPTCVPFRERLSACADGTSTLPDVDAAWCRKALPASDLFVGVAALLSKGGTIDFDDDKAPTPTPTMRIVPAV